MTKEEIFEKWCELTNTYIEKEAELEVVVYQWLNDEDSAMSKESVEHLIDSTNPDEQIGVNQMMKITCYFWFEGWDSDCFPVLNASPVFINLGFSMVNDVEF